MTIAKPWGFFPAIEVHDLTNFFGVIYERSFQLSMEVSFFVLCPYKCTGVALIIGI